MRKVSRKIDLFFSCAFGIFTINAAAASQLEAFKGDHFGQTTVDFEAYKNQLISDFDESKKEFEEYLEIVNSEIAEYRENLSKYWQEPEVYAKERWIEYSPDEKSRSEVDFEKNVLTIQTIAPSLEEADRKLKQVLERAITLDTKKFRETNPLEKKIRQISKTSSIQTSEPKQELIIADVIFDGPPKKSEVTKYVDNQLTKDRIAKMPSKTEGENVYTLRIDLPPDAAIKKAKKYIKRVREEAKIRNVSPSLVLAIMQTESYFNPLARSHIPAFGLMQIVPKTAGVDAYDYLYGKKKIVSADYLYDSDNNIRMGSAYLHILYYRYFKDIKDPLSRLYCSIAAYNTGAGNISWVFNNGRGFKYPYSVGNAAPIINALTPDQVYHELITKLKHREAREYLEKVVLRTKSFMKVDL